MFLKFSSTEERRKYGGSAFVEIQYCKLPSETPLKKRVSIKALQNWDLSSLYVHVDDLGDFLESYVDIFQNGLNENVIEGPMDVFDINYYSEDHVSSIRDRLLAIKPKDYEILLEWLANNPYGNGIYILGI